MTSITIEDGYVFVEKDNGEIVKYPTTKVDKDGHVVKLPPLDLNELKKGNPKATLSN